MNINTNKKKFRFRKFQIYNDSLKFRTDIKKLTEKYFPKEEHYLLTDQILRATNSIILNIAEGADRSTDKDFANFLNKSHTSINEVVACLDIALVDNYIPKKNTFFYLDSAEKLANQITAFRRKLLNDNN